MKIDNLELSIIFAQKANESKRLLDNYKEDYKKYLNKEIKWSYFYKKYSVIPTKQEVLDNIKMARKYLNLARKEVEKCY